MARSESRRGSSNRARSGWSADRGGPCIQAQHTSPLTMGHADLFKPRMGWCANRMDRRITSLGRAIRPSRSNSALETEGMAQGLWIDDSAYTSATRRACEAAGPAGDRVGTLEIDRGAVAAIAEHGHHNLYGGPALAMQCSSSATFAPPPCGDKTFNSPLERPSKVARATTDTWKGPSVPVGGFAITNAVAIAWNGTVRRPTARAWARGGSTIRLFVVSRRSRISMWSEWRRGFPGACGFPSGDRHSVVPPRDLRGWLRSSRTARRRSSGRA